LLLLIEANPRGQKEKSKMREEWTRPEIEEMDIAEQTQLEGGGSGDTFDPVGGLGEGEGGAGGGGGAAPSS